MDQRLHRLTHDVPDVVEGVAHAVGPDGELARPPALLVADHHGLAFEALQALGTLLEDTKRLPHLVAPDAEPAVAVARIPGLDLEVVRFVAAVRLLLTQVPVEAGG